LTAQGHPRAIFQRAIDHGNLMGAEMAARAMGRVSLQESLALTVLAVEKAPGKRNAFTTRWLRRLLEEDANITIDEAVLAASALASLGGRGHEHALVTLRGVVETASRQPRRSRVPEVGR
jgi:hypothetical protein